MRRGSTLRVAALVAATALATACNTPPQAAQAPKTAEELFQEADALLEGSTVLFFLESVDYVRAIASFQQIIDEYPFSEYATLAELKIGDAYFAQRNFAQAASFYQEFVELHPTHPKVPYALLRNGECAFEQMLDPDQDQGKTRDAVKLFDVLIARYPQAEELERARELRARAVDRLAQSEAIVGDFYFSSEKFHAAVPRYRDALAQSPEHPGHHSTRARLGLSLLRVGQTEEGNRILRAVLPDPELDGDVRDQIEDELGVSIPIETSEAEEESGGFSLWPFGGDSKPVASVELRDAGAPVGEGGAEAPAEREPASQQPDSNESELAKDSRPWYWPF